MSHEKASNSRVTLSMPVEGVAKLLRLAEDVKNGVPEAVEFDRQLREAGFPLVRIELSGTQPDALSAN